MPTRPKDQSSTTSPAGENPREQLLAGLGVTERRLELAGVRTAVLEGGDGPPVVLLHGPGEFAVKWLRVIPDLVATHRVVAPDLPAHGSSERPDGPLDAERMLAWLDELIERTCPAPPTLVGHVLGGAIAARFAVDRGDRIANLVLVDTLGLAKFRPAPKFALTMLGFVAHPSEATYERFMRQCSFDLDALQEEMGERWAPFVAYNLERACSPSRKAVGPLFRELGLRPLPPDDLARITVPTTLVWGRHDRANPLSIAEAAAARYGWPLHVIDDCADDPARDQPQAFLAALRRSLAVSTETTGEGEGT
ncbi:MAG: alpha/beta hydrolase [Actinobacteria bacterium]|nr:alpha/beta hydrolase [Actinomycetota bacterium]